MMKVFSEIQRFDQWWLRLLVFIIVGVMIGSYILKFEGIKNDSAAFWVTTIAFFVVLILLFMVVIMLKLETKVDEQGIYYSFWPIRRSLKLIPWHDISNCRVRKYNPLTEYGGWGYRMSFGNKSGAINVKGNIGIQIEQKNGKKLLIGTQKEKDAKAVLETYSHKCNMAS